MKMESEKGETESEHRAADPAGGVGAAREAPTTAPTTQKVKAKQRHHHVFAETEIYQFSTAEVLRVARVKWGAKSRRVTALYDLLSDMIEEAGRKT